MSPARRTAPPSSSGAAGSDVLATDTVAVSRKSPSTGFQTSTPRCPWNQSARRVSVRTSVPPSARASTEAGLKIDQPSKPGMPAADAAVVGPGVGLGVAAVVAAGVAVASAAGLPGPVDPALPAPQAAATASRRATATDALRRSRLPIVSRPRSLADAPLALFLDELQVVVEVLGLRQLAGHLGHRKDDHLVRRRDALGRDHLLDDLLHLRLVERDGELALHVDRRFGVGLAALGRGEVLEV